MSFIDDIIQFLGGPIHQACNPGNLSPPPPCAPLSTFVILGVSLGLSTIAMAANRFLVDYKLIARSRQESMEVMRALRKAQKEGDKKEIDKAMRRNSAAQKMQLRAFREQMKTTVITFLPFWLIYLVLTYALTSPVAFVPFVFPFGPDLPLFIWYTLCSIAISIPLSRLMGVSAAYSMSPTSTDTK